MVLAWFIILQYYRLSDIGKTCSGDHITGIDKYLFDSDIIFKGEHEHNTQTTKVTTGRGDFSNLPAEKLYMID